jgi:hypothetical protein
MCESVRDCEMLQILDNEMCESVRDCKMLQILDNEMNESSKMLRNAQTTPEAR